MNEIACKRMQISELFVGLNIGKLAIIGPCALTIEPELIQEESEIVRNFELSLPGLIALRRLPPWKPRTKKEDWHGAETTHPLEASHILGSQAAQFANVAIEIGKSEHLARYVDLLAFGWIGGRNFGESGLMKEIVCHDPSLPIGVKNNLNGDVEGLMECVSVLRMLRSPSEAPIIPVFRGGEDCPTPELWGEAFKRISEVTNGKFIIDAAHGSEMAHAPKADFKKTIEGQENTLNHIIDLQKLGYPCLGVMVEASDAKSPTDPNIPLMRALELIRHIHNSR